MKKLLSEPTLVVAIDDNNALKIAALANNRNYNYVEAGNLIDYQINTGTVYGVGATLPTINPTGQARKGINTKIIVKRAPPLWNVVPSLTGNPIVQNSYSQLDEWNRIRSGSNKLRKQDYLGAETILGRNLTPNEIQSRVLDRKIPADQERYLRGTKGYYNPFPSTPSQLLIVNQTYAAAPGPDANIKEARALNANPQFPHPYLPSPPGSLSNVSGRGPVDPVVNPTVAVMPQSRNDPSPDYSAPNPPTNRVEQRMQAYRNQIALLSNILVKNKVKNERDARWNYGMQNRDEMKQREEKEQFVAQGGDEKEREQKDYYGDEKEREQKDYYPDANVEDVSGRNINDNNSDLAPPPVNDMSDSDGNRRALAMLENIHEAVGNADLEAADAVPYDHEERPPQPLVPTPSQSTIPGSGPLLYPEYAQISANRPLSGGLQNALPPNMRNRANMVSASGPPSMQAGQKRKTPSTPFSERSKTNGYIPPSGVAITPPGTGPEDVFQGRNTQQLTSLSSAGPSNVINIPLSSNNLPLESNVPPEYGQNKRKYGGRGPVSIAKRAYGGVPIYMPGRHAAVNSMMANFQRMEALLGPNGRYNGVGGTPQSLRQNLDAMSRLLGNEPTSSSVPVSIVAPAIGMSPLILPNQVAPNHSIRTGRRITNAPSPVVTPLTNIVQSSGGAPPTNAVVTGPPITNNRSRRVRMPALETDLDAEDDVGGARRSNRRAVVEKRGKFTYGAGMRQVGRFSIHGGDLKRKEFNVVDMHTGHVRHGRKLTDHMHDIMMDWTAGKKPTGLSRMDPKEALMLYSMARDSGSHRHMALLPPASKVSLGMKIKIAMGEIDAGNNSKELKGQLYDNIRLAEKQGDITTEQYRNIFQKYHL